LSKLFDATIDTCTQFVRKECKEIGPSTDIGLFRSLCNILQTTLVDFPDPNENTAAPTKEVSESLELRIEYRFFFALVWSLGGVLDAASRIKFDEFLRTLMQMQGRRAIFPKDGTIYDFVFKYDFMLYGRKDVESASSSHAMWMRWVDTIEQAPSISPSLKFNQITIPTKDTARYGFLMDLLIPNAVPFLFVGPTGRKYFVVSDMILLAF
jgi:dynein heavy chain